VLVAGLKEITVADQTCAHIAAVTTIKTAKRYECEECMKIHARWMHLRTCQTCGVTLCCDDSPNKHASKHAKSSTHPVISSAEPGERWLYCYPDEAFVEY
jgi:uncharacterized UBP type Zn finger protein